MTSSLQKLLVGCTWLLLTHAAYSAPPTPEKIHMPLNALLQSYCPAKHLDLLSPADFNGTVDPFRISLPSAKRGQLDQAADPAKTCADTAAGTAAETSCANLAYIKAATQLKLLPLFAKKICALPLVCRGQSKCS